mmetsp:Transcript_13835/g.35651  ORF Transcript_13835/g.35651 Transcript_13835/m.35651 type:complete len:300 (+) Transcript_13835:1-900(+)
MWLYSNDKLVSEPRTRASASAFALSGPSQLELKLSDVSEPFRGTRHATSLAPTGPMFFLVKSSSVTPLSEPVRISWTGTPQTSPLPAHAMATSSSSGGGSPSPVMQLRRAAVAARLSILPPSSSSSSSSSCARSAAWTAAMSTCHPPQRSHSRPGSRAASHTRPASCSIFASTSVTSDSGNGANTSRPHASRAKSTRRASPRHDGLAPLSSASVPTSTRCRALAMASSLTGCAQSEGCRSSAGGPSEPDAAAGMGNSGVSSGSASAAVRSLSLSKLSVAPSSSRSSTPCLAARRQATAR